MAQTRVKNPDGSWTTVNHPAGATQQEIEDFAAREFELKTYLDQQNQRQNQQESQELPQGGSIADSLGHGASFGFSDEIAGALGAAIGTFDDDLEGTTFGERYRGIRDAARANREAFETRNPKTAIAAELAGGLTTGGLGAAKAGAFQAARNAPTFMGRMSPVIQTGAVQGGLFGAGTSEGDSVQDIAGDALKGAGIGAATAPVLPLLGSGARKGAERVFRPMTNNPVYQRALDLLKNKAGITTPTTGQKTGSRAIKSTETTAAETLFGGRVFRQLDENRRKLQTALMRMAGFSRSNDDVVNGLITREALDDAADRFSRRYSEMLKGRQLDMGGEDFVEAIAAVQARNSRYLKFQQKKEINEIVNQIFDDVTSGPVTATKYNQVRSRLAQLEANNAARPDMQQLYRELKNAIDDEVASQLGLGVRKRALDKQYARFATIRDTFEGLGGADPASGYLPLASMLRRSQGKRGADREFQDLVRAGQAVLGDPTPNSATASRLANLAFLGEGAATLGGVLDPTAGALTMGIPMFGAQALGRGWTGNTAANRLIDAGLLTVPAIQQGLINTD